MHMFSKKISSGLLLIFLLTFSLHAPLDASAAWNVWLDHSIKKYRQNGEDGTSGSQSLIVKMAKNEFESFQVFIYANGENLNNVDVNVTNFSSGSSTIDNIYIYKEHYVNCSTYSRIEYQSGFYPDALLPKVDRYYNETRNTFPLSVENGKVQGVWIDIGTDVSSTAGTYNTMVTISADGKPNIELPVTLIVWDFALPSTPTYPAMYKLGTSSMTFGHGLGLDAGWNGTQEAIELEKQYNMAYLLHKVQPVSSSGRSSQVLYSWDNRTKSLEITNWQPWEEINSPFLSGTAITSGPYAGAQFKSSTVMGTIGFGGWPTEKNGNIATADKETAARQYAQEWFDKYQSNGWDPYNRLFFGTQDEPRCTDNITFRGQTMSECEVVLLQAQDVNAVDTHGLGLLKNAYTHSRNTRDGLETFGNYGFYSPNFYSAACYGWDRTCQWNTPSAPRQEYPDYPNDRFWPYLACDNNGCSASTSSEYNGQIDSSVDAPAMYNRAVSFMMWKYEGNGTFFWDTTWNNYEGTGDPYYNMYSYGSNGDGHLLYPGIPTRTGRSWTVGKGTHTPAIGGTRDIPIASMRWKYIRDWIEDTDMMELAKAQAGKAAVDAVVNTLFTDISINRAYWDFNMDPNVLLTARDAIASQINDDPTNPELILTISPPIIE